MLVALRYVLLAWLSVVSSRLPCVKSGTDGPRRWPDSVLARVHFFAWVSSKDAALLSHFLAWYVGLGIPLELRGRSRIILHGNGISSDLDGRNASMTVLWEVMRDVVNHNVVWSTEPFSAIAKTARANEFMDGLASDALMVRADLDEFFDVSPSAVKRAVDSRFGFIKGRMLDRISLDWSLKRILPIPPIWEQFPRRCRATHKIFGGNDKKWILVPVLNKENGKRVSFKTSHNVRNGPVDEKALESFDIAHYRFDYDAYALAILKRNAYVIGSDKGSITATNIYDKVIKSFENRENGKGFTSAAIATIIPTDWRCGCDSALDERRSVESNSRGVVYAALEPSYLDITMLGALRLAEGSNVVLVVDQKTARYCDIRKAALRRPNWICAAVDLETLQVSGVSSVNLPGSILDVWKSLRNEPAAQFHISRRVQWRIVGILAMLATPFFDTLFLDSDNFPCFDMRTLFSMTEPQHGVPEVDEDNVVGLLDYEDILISYHNSTLGGFLRRGGLGMPNAFGLFNTGVMLYRARDCVLEFLVHWLDLYLQDLQRKIQSHNANHTTRDYQRQSAMQWAMYHGVANNGLRVHPLSPVWNVRSWLSPLSGINKGVTRNFDPCCKTNHPSMPITIIDNNCDIDELIA